MKIFISYARVNRKQVEMLEKLLTDLGHDAWFDREIVAGEDWWKSITSSIERCEVFVFALSPQSTNSSACRAEFQYALDLNKPILPVMLLDAELPVGKLRETQFVNGRALNRPETIIELSKALSVLKDRVAAGEFPPPDPLPSRPAFPFPPDPLAEIRQKLEHIDTLTEQDMLEIVYQLSATARVGAKTEREALTILREIARYPRSTLRVVQVAKEAIQLRSGRRTIAVFIGVSILVIIMVAFTAVVLTNRARNDIERTRNAGETQSAVRAAETQVALNNQIMTLSQATGTLDSRLRTLEAAEYVLPTSTATATQLLVSSPVATLSFVLSRETVNSFAQVSTYTHDNSLRSLAFKPDGQTIALGASVGTILFWEVASQAISRSIEPDDCPNVISLDYSWDGRFLAFVCDGRGVRLIDLDTLGSAHALSTNAANVVRFSPDGRQVAAGMANGVVNIWDVSTNELAARFASDTNGIWGVDFSRDGSSLLSGGTDGVLRIFSLNDDTEAFSIANTNSTRIYDVEFSPNGEWVAWSTASANIYLRSLETSEQYLLPREHIDSVFDIDFTPDGLYLVSVSVYGQVIVWDVAAREKLRLIDYRREYSIPATLAVIEEVALSPDGTMFATVGRDGVMRLWDFRS